ncbi:MAG: hypothetical protein U1E76_08715 [Planctomycetota bacterium]
MMCGTAICVLLLAAQAPPAPGHDHLYQDTLRNGLRLVLAEDHAAPLVHLRLLVGTGPGLASEDPPGLGLLIASAALREASGAWPDRATSWSGPTMWASRSASRLPRSRRRPDTSPRA